MPNFQYDGSLPTRSIPRGRSCSNILFDPFFSLIVAASSLQTKFTYDEDGNRVWEPESLVRAFDSDERFVGVAFMEMGVYVHSLRTLKNLLLVGDAVKSVMFVAFQVRSFNSNENVNLGSSQLVQIGRCI